jgi:4-hydroxybenzoate polyprenyltransferase
MALRLTLPASQLSGIILTLMRNHTPTTPASRNPRLSIASQIRPLIRTMRLKQYTKNVFVWAAVLFDQKLLQWHPFSRTLVAFLLFCLLSSAIYIINDLVDIERDRLHPTKRFRPLPAGTLSATVAGAAAFVLTAVSLGAAFIVHPTLALLLVGYFILMICYSFWLKNVVIVDVLAIAAGFVLRVGAGVVVVQTERFSPWMYVCMILLALFLALGKRRQEIVLLKEQSANTRTILERYNLRFIDEMLAVVSSSTVMAYSLYTFSAPNVPPNHTMMLTIPFVLYAIFRYLYLIHVEGETDPPDVVLLRDRPLQIDIGLFGIFVFIIFYLLPRGTL